MQLNGKRALITGAGSGIGRALAIEASRRGITVGLSGRRAACLRETAAMMAPGSRHLLLPGDLTLPAMRRELRAFLSHGWGRLELLVNNAGVMHARPLVCTSDDDISRIMETNVAAPIALTRELLPLLRKAAPSRVVNVGSIFGDIAHPLFGIYSASKFALRGLSMALRRELEPVGVGVTYAAPRATRTDAARAFDALIEPLQMRLDEPEVVAAKIWHAVEREADTAYAGGPERLFVLLQRLFPKLVDHAIARQMADIRVRAYLSELCRATRAQEPAVEGGGVQPGFRSAPACGTDHNTHNGFSKTRNFSEEQHDVK